MRQDKSLNFQNFWTDEDTRLLLECIDQEMNTRQIALKLHRTMSSIRGRIRKLRHTHGIKIRPRVYVKAGARAHQAEVFTKWEPPDPVRAEREHRRSLSRRDLTAEFFGDPLPGYSALDRLRAQSPHSHKETESDE